MAEGLKAPISIHALSFDHLTDVSGVGLSPTLGTQETSQGLLAGFPDGFFSGFSLFQPTYRLASLISAELILKGT